MTTKTRQWGTAIYDSEGELPLSGSGGGAGGLRLKRLHIVKGMTAADLPDPMCFGVNVASRLDGDVVMSPALFTELLGAVATSVALKQAVAASGYDIPGFANIAKTPAGGPRRTINSGWQAERAPVSDEDCFIATDGPVRDCGACDDDADGHGYIGASLIVYENRVEPSPREVGQLQHINDLFANGWQYDRNVSPDLILLKRQKG